MKIIVKAVVKTVMSFFVLTPLMCFSLMLIVGVADTVAAEAALSKDLINRYINTQEVLDSLDKTHPDLARQMNSVEFDGRGGAIEAIKKLEDFSEIEEIVQTQGFAGVDELFQVAQRFMGAIYAVKLQEQPQLAGFMAEVEKISEQQMAQMQASGASPEMLAEMKVRQAEMQQHTLGMQAMLQAATPADKKFVRENMAWVMDKMDAMAE